MPKPPAHDTAYHEVLEALAASGCPVCRLSDRRIHQRLEALIYEQINDPDLRQQLRASWGFCQSHARQLLARHGGTLSVAILYGDIPRSALAELAVEHRGPLVGLFLGDATRRPHRTRPACPICCARADIERRYVGVVLEHAVEQTFRQAYRDASGLCLPHLTAALADADGDGAAFLVEVAREQIAPLRDTLDEFVRKHDYRFTAEGFSDVEATAPGRAVLLASGGTGWA